MKINDAVLGLLLTLISLAVLHTIQSYPSWSGSLSGLDCYSSWALRYRFDLPWLAITATCTLVASGRLVAFSTPSDRVHTAHSRYLFLYGGIRRPWFFTNCMLADVDTHGESSSGACTCGRLVALIECLGSFCFLHLAACATALGSVDPLGLVRSTGNNLCGPQFLRLSAWCSTHTPCWSWC